MRHVLVIEDQYILAQCVADMALFSGASSVDIAEDTEGAIEAARHHCPTIIISDVDLKKGGRGPDAVARIREICGEVPTIFVTGNPDDPKARSLANIVLSKPVSPKGFSSAFRVVARDLPPWKDVLGDHA